MGGRTNWGVGRRINNIQSQWSTVMTWDSFETVADALKFMNGEFAQPQVSNSNMAEIAPNGFTSRIIVTPVMWACLLYTSPSPRDKRQSRMPSSA